MNVFCETVKQLYEPELYIFVFDGINWCVRWRHNGFIRGERYLGVKTREEAEAQANKMIIDWHNSRKPRMP